MPVRERQVIIRFQRTFSFCFDLALVAIVLLRHLTADCHAQEYEDDEDDIIECLHLVGVVVSLRDLLMRLLHWLRYYQRAQSHQDT